MVQVNGGDPFTSWISYTPSVTASTGTFTSVSATASYKIIGKSMYIRGTCTITTINTASGRAILTFPSGVTAVNSPQPLAGFYSTLLALPAAAAYDTTTSLSLSLAAFGAGTVGYFCGVVEIV